MVFSFEKLFYLIIFVWVLIYSSVRDGIIYQARLHYEDNGHLEFVHSETGVRTLRQEFDKVAQHNEHHLEQMKIALEAV